MRASDHVTPKPGRAARCWRLAQGRNDLSARAIDLFQVPRLGYLKTEYEPCQSRTNTCARQTDELTLAIMIYVFSV